MVVNHGHTSIRRGNQLAQIAGRRRFKATRTQPQRRKAQGCCGHDSGGYSLHRHSPSALVALFYFPCSGAGKCTGKNAYPFIGRKQYFHLILVLLNHVVPTAGNYTSFIHPVQARGYMLCCMKEAPNVEQRNWCLSFSPASLASGIHKPTAVGVKMEGRGKQSLCDCAAPAIEHRLF